MPLQIPLITKQAPTKGYYFFLSCKQYNLQKFVLEIFMSLCYNVCVYRNNKDVTSLKKRKTAVVVGIIIALLLSVFALFSVSAYSENDPLITLSYLQDILFPAFKDDIMTQVNTAIEDLSQRGAEYDDKAVPAVSDEAEDAENVDGIDSNSSADATYTLLELTKGQTVMADSICEFIVRPGSNVCAVSPFPSQGIADITNGIEVLDGEKISINAYCLIPRGSDGRGMTVISDKAYIMIRGDYTIG